MATIKALGDGATEIKIDGLNGVLFIGGRPVAAVVSGGGFMIGERVGATNKTILEWMLYEWKITGASSRPQSFFDNILTVYMNPAMHDTPERGGEDDK